MPIKIDVADRIATITINRPDALNAIDPESRKSLHEMWDRVGHDDEIRVAILTGAGERAFCAGVDLKKAPPATATFAQAQFGAGAGDNLLAGLDTDKPLIAAINGICVGGGMELALALDIRIASENARMGLTEAKIGSIPGSGGTQRLPRLIGGSDAMSMLLTGDLVDAQEALRMGLVSRVVPAGELMASARAVATRIAANAPLSVQAIKRLVRRGLESPLASALQMERSAFGVIRGSDDWAEGRRAFREKRTPDFKGG